jgi:hypothetical protein
MVEEKSVVAGNAVDEGIPVGRVRLMTLETVFSRQGIQA